VQHKALSNLDLAVAWATIATFVVVLLGGIAYASGVLWPLTIEAIQERTFDDNVPVIQLSLFVTNRSRNGKTISEPALVRNPGFWNRRVRRRARLVNIKTLSKVSVIQPTGGNLHIDGHDSILVQSIYPKPALPFGAKTAVYVNVASRHFFCVKIVDDTPPAIDAAIRSWEQSKPKTAGLAEKTTPSPKTTTRDLVLLGTGTTSLRVSRPSEFVFRTARLLSRYTGQDILDVYARLIDDESSVWLQGIDEATAKAKAAELQQTGASVHVVPLWAGTTGMLDGRGARRADLLPLVQGEGPIIGRAFFRGPDRTPQGLSQCVAGRRAL
jgi:hypothetical protein